MAFVKITKQHTEHTTLKLHPEVNYISSSEGVTGEVFLTPDRSTRFKDPVDITKMPANNTSQDTSAFEDAKNGSNTMQRLSSGQTSANVQTDLQSYLDYVNSTQVSMTQRCKFGIKRITPNKLPVFDIDTSVKNTIRKNLNPKYLTQYPDLGYHYGNYHTLNFFDSSDLPSDSCLIYPNYNDKYLPADSFTLSFWINPKYDNDVPGSEFHAATLFHLSSSIAASLVSGSLLDKNGLVSSYKILLQLSQSADVAPDKINLNSLPLSFPNDLIFLSNTEIQKNTWNHVTIRWSPNHQERTGSMIINRTSTDFYVNSSSISSTYSALSTKVQGLVLGNFFDTSPANMQALFGIPLESTEGITRLAAVGTEPANQKTFFKNPGKAELHNIMLFNKYLNDYEVFSIERFGISKKKVKGSDVNNLYDHLLFYVPPYFVPQTLRRKQLLTPFLNFSTSGKRVADVHEPVAIQGGTFTPFNSSFSFRYGENLINLENFVADFANPKSLSWPRLQSLTASYHIPTFKQGVTPQTSATKFIYDVPGFKKRNLTILPNDNGLFKPDYYPIAAGIHSKSMAYMTSITSFTSESYGLIHESPHLLNYVQFDKSVDYARISLENLVPYLREYFRVGPTYVPAISPPGHNAFSELFGPHSFMTHLLPDATAADLALNITTHTAHHGSIIGDVNPPPKYAIPAVTKDVSSNEVVIFDVTNLMFGNQIKEKSLVIYESDLTGSSGKIKIRLRDNGDGLLYRADSLTRHATWNKTGDVIYQEGLITILSPHLIKFCENTASISFRGDQNLHTMIINTPFHAGLFNSSSNKKFISNPPTVNVNDREKKSLFFSALNIHDENFNIIMRAHFAQPILKTEDDEFVVRLRMDF